MPVYTQSVYTVGVLFLLTPALCFSVSRALHLAVIHQHEPFLDFLLGFSAGTEYLDLQNDLGQVSCRGLLGEGLRVQGSQCDLNPCPVLL
jgi:hypothetical protein